MRAGRSLIAMGVAVACTLAGGLLTAGSASAASRGYQVYNLSSHPLELAFVGSLAVDGVPGLRYAFDFEGRPNTGAVMAPGDDPQDFELKYSFGDSYGANLTWKIVGTDKYVTATIVTTPFTNTSTCRVDLGQCTAEGGTIVILDAPGTVHEVPASQAQAQAQTLRALCTQTSKATCEFTPRKDEKLMTPQRLIGAPSTNCQDTPADGTVGQSDTVSESNSVGISIGVEFDTGFFIEKVKAKVVATYGHTWVHQHEFTEDLHYKITPGDLAWVVSSAPIFRDTGDFELKLGNTTWNLRGVYFDTPDPGRVARWTTDHRKLTPAEYQAACPHAIPENAGPAPAPAAWVSMRHDGSDGHDRFVGGPESNIVRGRDGNDHIIGGAGHDTLSGGPGADRLSGGPGRDELSGGPGRDVLDGGGGADTITDRSGATVVLTGAAPVTGRDVVDVRDGHPDDVVICQSPRSLVVADVGDVVRGGCGQVFRTTFDPDHAGMTR
jgi:hypothetical protein